MQATNVTYNFLVVTLKKEKESSDTNFYNIFNPRGLALGL